jgi:DNA polymerase-1
MHGALWKGASRALLVDGHHLFHRCLHMQESNPLLGPDGAPTGALFGVVRALRAFRRDIPADVGIVVYDDGGSSFRSTLYPAYKANRTALEEPTKKQLQQSKYWARALGWTVYQSQGVEADDTLAFLTKQRGHREAVMITGDKDLAQLVVDEPPAVLIWRPDFSPRASSVLVPTVLMK